MKTLGLIVLVAFLILFSVFFVRKIEDFKTTPTPTPAVSPAPSSTASPTPIPDAVIGPGESAEVQCGEGNDGVRVEWKGKSGGYTSVNGQVELTAGLLDVSLKPTNGALVKWSLYDWGTLSIKGCKATFTAPDSIGLAYSTSATISTRVVTTPPPSPTTGGGEGGPIFAGYSNSAKITIYSENSSPTCHDPAGVAVSINSVPTTSNVQIVVDTPRFQDRVYNGRNFTVRDGPGTYYIQIFVNNALYGQTNSTVSECQLPTVKF